MPVPIHVEVHRDEGASVVLMLHGAPSPLAVGDIITPYKAWSAMCLLSGGFLSFAGRSEEGIPWIEKALDINPLDPRNYVVRTHLAVAKICVGDYEQAVELAREATGQRPDYIDSHVALAAALGYLGRIDEALAAVGEFRDKAQDYAENHPLWGSETKECFLNGLRKANLVE